MPKDKAPRKPAPTKSIHINVALYDEIAKVIDAMRYPTTPRYLLDGAWEYFAAAIRDGKVDIAWKKQKPYIKRSSGSPRPATASDGEESRAPRQ